VTDHIVVGDRVLLDISFRAAQARLRILARDGVLPRASEEAYGEGITGLMQLAGPAAGLTRLAGSGWKTWRKQITVRRLENPRAYENLPRRTLGGDGRVRPWTLAKVTRTRGRQGSGDPIRDGRTAHA
jgi:hypothetical protein